MLDAMGFGRLIWAPEPACTLTLWVVRTSSCLEIIPLQVEREIRIHSQLNHKNIIRLYAAFEDSDNVYLAQEFASGIPLK